MHPESIGGGSGLPTVENHGKRRSRRGWLYRIVSRWGVLPLFLAVGGCAWGISAEDLDFETHPYIGHTTTTSSTISWVTAEPSIGRVWFGAHPGELEQLRAEVEPRKIHEVQLDGLVPNTRYRYRVEPSAQGDGSGSFWTAPAASDAFSFVVVGDTRAGHAFHRSIVRNILQLEPAPRFVFNVGDMVSDGESVPEWRAFFEVVAPLAKVSPYYSTLGNHERDADVYFELFSLPRNGAHPERNYSFDWGNAHFTVIDAGKKYRDDERQLAWLAQDLERAQAATFRIVFFHQSGHGTRPARSEEHEEISRLLDGTLERGRVDLVFNGHDHNYVHASKNGVDYVVTGGGGSVLHELGPPTGETIAQRKIHHFCRVSVSAEELEVVAIDSEGRPIDSFVRRASRP
jgi:hypothetical protein